MEQIKAKPFLKWAGGKSKLIPELENRYPEELLNGKINTYVEPFIGGGAVYFDIASKFHFDKIIINDINSELILTYKVIKNNVGEVINYLNKYQEEYNNLSTLDEKEECYYKIRDEFNKGKGNVNYHEIGTIEIEHAAYMIFLNKSCFNGLYRENKKGGFNVPFGKKEKINTYEEENLRAVNKLLQKTIILNGDFEKVKEYINNKTFIYMDPPYRPLKGKGSFKDYSKEEFNDDTQIRLAEFYKKIAHSGAKVMESNSDPKNSDEGDLFFDELYKEFRIDRINAARNINSKGNGRGKISEILVTSY
ncbi:DNA adenine methylase [Clostridium beijerinckii]|uniref:DNA adenine methylase n=1 Tax=Clostridium beijerinckii TaxID=1520 RepID=UPI002225FAD9|nr:DNA adenine methylase [Clostridium beijerinckii]UYZ38002.1 DNA adenine methylase [Clostridium beijerinckii]